MFRQIRQSVRNISERGQASLEMIMLLIIGVIVILGLVYRFNTAFKKYTIEMYGTYYRCLLETGELPGTGSVCRDRDARFDIANGRALVADGDTRTGGTDDGSGGSGGSGSGGSGSGGSGSGGSGGSGSGGSGKGGSGKGGSGGSGNQAGSGGGSGGSGGSGDSGGGSEAVGGSRRNGGRGSVVAKLRNAGRSRSTSVGSASDLSKEDADQAAAGENGLIVDATGAKYSRDSLRSAKTKMAFSMEGDQYQREETKAVAPIAATATKKAADRGGDSLRPRKAVEKGDRAPAKKRDEDNGGGLEFGKLFRLFLIIGIIVAIAVFLGGQVLQISKSGER